jgi:hypothetical protein
MGAFIPEAAIVLMGRDMTSYIGVLLKDPAAFMADVITAAQASNSSAKDRNLLFHANGRLCKFLNIGAM